MINNGSEPISYDTISNIANNINENMIINNRTEQQ